MGNKGVEKEMNETNENEINKLNNKIIVLEKILQDNEYDTNYVEQLKLAYMEKHGILKEKLFSIQQYVDFANEYMEHVRDIIKMVYKKSI